MKAVHPTQTLKKILRVPHEMTDVKLVHEIAAASYPLGLNLSQSQNHAVKKYLRKLEEQLKTKKKEDQIGFLEKVFGFAPQSFVLTHGEQKRLPSWGFSNQNVSFVIVLDDRKGTPLSLDISVPEFTTCEQGDIIFTCLDRMFRGL